TKTVATVAALGAPGHQPALRTSIHATGCGEPFAIRERVDPGSFTQSPSQNRAGHSHVTRLPLPVPRLSHERASEQTAGVAGPSLSSAILWSARAFPSI